MSSGEDKSVNKLVHDARSPLNRISMNAEMIKLILENDMPKEKGIQAVDKIINACQECSDTLQLLSTEHGDK
ncbi:histidine kinase [uncultured Paraglaciecola sp.]|uniref:histidine kinase n=1 Tax=uncultured Paraglaciecola sp. TaxID=1765024 RepID=UPI0030D7B39B|tara:strand:+ start:28189 stop:28404 length:216 start_codon:yes stop_codon:yes gene_type:complete